MTSTMTSTQTLAIETNAIKEIVRQIIAKVGDLEMDIITDDAAFVEDLGLDSLAATEILFEVEKTYSISFSDDDAHSIKRLSDVPERILAHLKSRPQSPITNR